MKLLALIFILQIVAVVSLIISSHCPWDTLKSWLYYWGIMLVVVSLVFAGLLYNGNILDAVF